MNNYLRDIICTVIQYKYLLYMIIFQSFVFGLIFLFIGEFPIYHVGITFFYMFLYAILIFIPLNALFIVIKCIIIREKNPTVALLNYFYSKLGDGIFLTHFVITAIVFGLALIIFSSIKSSIPIIISFWADPYFVDLDRVLFFGILPHEFFGFLYENDSAIIVLNFSYHLWTILVVLFMFYISLTSNNKLRFQVLHASVLAWFIAGNWMAIILASVGPVYYEYFFDGNMLYSPMMETLEVINERTGKIWALNAQRMLLSAYNNPESPISGISAMPSMHVVFAFIIAFAAMEVSRLATIAGYLFALFILVGSVVLGWHYAVDGIVGVLAAIVIWKISHPITLRAIGTRNSAQTDAAGKSSDES